MPRAQSRALCRAFVALGALLVALPAEAQTGRLQFSGELNYAAFRAAAERGTAVTIKYSPGGTGASALALARIPNVVIDGRCNSACAWSFVRNANACFTARASFGFHAAHDPGTGRRLNAATGYWLQHVRPSLRGKLHALLGTSSLIRVSASQMRRHYGDRVCGAAPRTEIAATTRRAGTVLATAQAGKRSARASAPAPSNAQPSLEDVSLALHLVWVDQPILDGDSLPSPAQQFMQMAGGPLAAGGGLPFGPMSFAGLPPMAVRLAEAPQQDNFGDGGTPSAALPAGGEDLKAAATPAPLRS